MVSSVKTAKTAIVISVLAVIIAFLFGSDYGTLLRVRLENIDKFMIRGQEDWHFYRGELDYAIFPWWGSARKIVRLDKIAKENGRKNPRM